jgi:hypothetical protein
MLLALAIALTSCPPTTSPAALLAANRAATLRVGKAGAGTIVTRYAYAAEGLTGRATSVVDPVTGAFLLEQAAGPVSVARGYDGELAWQRDFSGAHSPQAGGDKPALAANEAYRITNGWWRADRAGARIEPLACDAMRVTPPGGKSFEAWFDPKTGLLSRIREQQSFGSTIETRYGEYQDHRGWMLPARIEVITNDDASSPQTFALDAVEHPQRPPALFSMPRTQPTDWSLPAAGSVTLPFRLLNNHVFVDVRIDGKGPFPFLVDTGGHNILTTSTLNALGRISQGEGQSSGSGAASVSSGYAKVRSIDAGGAEVRDQTMVTLDFSPRAVEGIEVGGMLGAEFLQRFVVRFDYGASTLTLIDPRRFTVKDRAASGSAVPFTLYDHMPQVTGRFDAMPARFNIDTGSRSDVTMTRPFVARADLMRSYPKGITITDGWGVGGPARSRVIRAGSLALGPVVVPKPIAGLSAATRGAFSDVNYDGNVGSGLLKRFVATFEYRTQTLYLRPLARPDPDTGRFDRIGAWLNQGDAGPEIMDLASGGPAEVAGLRVGDAIVAIGDTRTTDRSLSDVRRMQKLLPEGVPIAVEYLRSGTRGSAIVRPRNLIPD